MQFGHLIRNFQIFSLNHAHILLSSLQLNTDNWVTATLGDRLFANLKINAFAHNSLNSSKGVVRSSELSLCTLEEIKNYLQNQGVSEDKRISIKRGDEIINTNTYIFTFNLSIAPKELKYSSI